MTRLRIIAPGLVLCSALASCGVRDGTGVMPELPRDGTAHFASSRPSGAEAEEDIWAGRSDLIAAPQAQAPAELTLPEVERYTLSNGLLVIVVRDNALPVASLQLAIRAGDRQVPRDKVGLARFAASMLPRGTRKRSASQIASDIESVGGILSANASFEATLLSCKTLSVDFGTCLATVADVVATPTFPEKELEIVRQNLHMSVRRRLDDASALANAHFQNLLWGKDHVRGWPLSEKTVDGIGRADLVAWHSTWLRPNNAILAVAGNVDPVQLRGQLEKAFRAWKKRPVPEVAAHVPPTIEGIQVRLVDKPGQTQSHIRIGHVGIAHADPDFFPALVFNHALGGGQFNSRLLKLVRSKKGAAYTASSSFDRNSDVGAFAAATFTRTSETIATVRTIKDEIAAMASEGPTPEEVASAITSLAGGYAARFETASDVAAALLAAELHEMPGEYVRDYGLRVGEVTSDRAKQAAARILHPDKLVIVIVGNGAEVEPQLQAANLRYEKVGYSEPIAEWERVEPQTPTETVDPEQVTAAGQILDQALAAKGGASKLRAVKSLSWRGAAEMTLGGSSMKAKLRKRFLAPDKLRLDLEVPDQQIKVVTVLSADKAWARERGPGGERSFDFPEEQVELLMTQLWRDQDMVLLRYLEKGARVEPAGSRVIGGHDHHAVKVTDASGQRSVVLFIDKKSKLLGGMEYTDQGTTATETFSDYRNVSGIKIAHQRSTRSSTMSLTATIEEFDVNSKIAPLIFVKTKEGNLPKRPAKQRPN